MKALVTGASGFIGSTLVEELNLLGFDVHALMRPTSSSAYLAGIPHTRVEGCLSDEASLRRAVADVDYVFHLAGIVTARRTRDFSEHNTEGTSRLARVVAEARPEIKRFVYVSSMAAGGPGSSPLGRTESDPDEPIGAYGKSKLAAEKALLQYKDLYPISILRPPMVYGPKDRAGFVFVQTIARNLMPILPCTGAEGCKHYSLIHGKDLARALVQAGLAPVSRVPSGEIFYVAGDGVLTYEQFVLTVAEQLSRTPLRIPVPCFALKSAAYAMSALSQITGKAYLLNIDKLNELLPDYWVCSNRKAKEMLGFVPEFDFVSGLANTIDWYRRNRWI